MSGFEAVEVCDRTGDMPVLGDDDALFDAVAERVGRGFRHLPRRLARGDEQHPSVKGHIRKRALHGSVRLHGGDRFLHDLIRMGTQ